MKGKGKESGEEERKGRELEFEVEGKGDTR